MTKRRDSFVQFFTHNYNLVQKSLFPLLGMALIMVQGFDNFAKAINVFFWVAVGFVVIASFLKWKNRTFEINEGIIRVSEGVLRKDQNDIPFNRIKSINTSDTLFKRICGVADLNVELIGGSQVAFVMAKGEVDRIKQEIFQREQITGIETQVETKKAIDYLLLGVSNIKVLLSSMSIAVATLSIVFNVLNKYVFETPKTDGKMEVIGAAPLEAVVMVTIGTAGFFALAGLAFSVFVGYLTFGDFSLVSNEKELSIKYGLLNKKTYLIPKKQIRTLVVAEPYLLKIFNRVQLRIENIGLSDGNSSTVVLFPLMKKEEAEAFVKNHIPDFSLREPMMKPKREGIPFYMWDSSWKAILVVLGLLWFMPSMWWLTLAIPLYMLAGFLEWKASGLSYDSEYIVCSDGGMFGKATNITLKKYVESTSFNTNVVSKKRGIGAYQFSVYSERITETYGCDFLTEDFREEFLAYLKK